MRFVARILACSLLLSLVATPIAEAAEATDDKRGITISPVQKQLTVSSGLVEATTNVVLTNKTGKNLIGTVRLLDFKTLKETSGLLFSQAGVPTNRYGLANWMTLPNGETINVLNGQSTTIPVHISNRADLAPGGHYGAVVVTLGTAAQANSTQASFKQELVSLILVNKLGGEDYGLLLDTLKADSLNKAPEVVTLKFRAAGNTHVTPRGYVTVSDIRGKVFAKGIINTESTTLLPGTSRQMITLLRVTEPKYASGRYKITAYYRNDEQTKFTEKTIYVNTFNRELLAVSGAVITGLGAALLVLNRRRKSV